MREPSYYVYDGRLKFEREKWGLADSELPFMAFEIEDRVRFRDTKFLERLFLRWHGDTLLLHGNVPRKKNLLKAETQLSVKSLIDSDLLVIKDYSEDAVRWAIDATERLGRWEEWAVGFLPKREVGQAVKCSMLDSFDAIGPFVQSGLFNYLTVRNFDNERLTVFTFREDTFGEMRKFIEANLSLAKPSPAIGGSDT